MPGCWDGEGGHVREGRGQRELAAFAAPGRALRSRDGVAWNALSCSSHMGAWSVLFCGGSGW